MNIKNLFIVNTVVAVVYGVAFVLLPNTVLDLYGISDGPGAIMMGRFFGGALISIGLVTWFARNSGQSEARRSIKLGLFISFIVSLIVSIHGTVSGAMSAFGWTAVVIYLFFILGYGNFLFLKGETVSSG